MIFSPTERAKQQRPQRSSLPCLPARPPLLPTQDVSQKEDELWIPGVLITRKLGDQLKVGRRPLTLRSSS